MSFVYIPRPLICMSSVAKSPRPTSSFYLCFVLWNQMNYFISHLHPILTIVIVTIFQNIFVFEYAACYAYLKVDFDFNRHVMKITIKTIRGGHL